MCVERAEPDGKHGCLSAGRNPFGLRSHYGRWPWAMPGPGRRKFLNCDSGGATRRSRSRSFGAMRCACTGATSVARATDRRRELTDHHHFFQPLPEMSKRIKRQTRGWGNYFKLGDPAQTFRLLNHYLTERLMQHLERRSQGAMKRPATESYPAASSDWA